ncbi:hypothetical protein OHA21_08485 [Actinoplanes sp. NBC_00393]
MDKHSADRIDVTIWNARSGKIVHRVSGKLSGGGVVVASRLKAGVH